MLDDIFFQFKYKKQAHAIIHCNSSFKAMGGGGGSGGAMVLGNLPVPGRPTMWLK